MKTAFKWLGCLTAIFLIAIAALYISFVFAPLPKRFTIVLDNYFSARALFLKRSAQAGATVESYRIGARGPRGEDLFIDIAWLGSKRPGRALLHISGTHGVEGFAGSAIQSKLLSAPPVLPPEAALILVHALNPWGMAHLRRFNENNVDLNRNFVLDPAGFNGAPDEYRMTNWFLNPEAPPRRLDSFVFNGLYVLARYGFVTLKQAIAGGQYEFPRGIYFGGKQLEEGPRLFVDWVKQHLSQTELLFVVEVHTGLGESAEDVLFWALPISDVRTRLLGDYLGESFQSDAPEAGVGFRTRGDLQNEVPKVLPGVKIGWTVEEFGTYGPVTALRALINENRHHFFGNGDVDHWSKRELLETFSPGSEKWQKRIVERGVSFATGFVPLLDPAARLQEPSSVQGSARIAR